MTYFYTRCIVVEELVTEIQTLDLSDRERDHLLALVDSSLHHVILDEILSNLSPTDKKAFLHRMKENPEDEKLMEFLSERIDGVENKIKKASEDLVSEMHKDVKNAKKLKGQPS